MQRFLNSKRLNDYPYLFLITIFFLLLVNLLLHQGWLGAFGQLIGGDYIMFYATGMLYKTDVNLIYDYGAQFQTQQALVDPTHLSGYNPYMNPPYVAMILSLLPLIPLSFSFIAWVCLSIIFCFISAYLLSRHFSPLLEGKSLSFKYLLIIILSFFPFIEGLHAGQNHSATLLLVTGLILAAKRERWLLAGVLAGMLLYKPQLILGLLILWVVWGNIKALGAFTSVLLLWVGSFLHLHGITPFNNYLETGRLLMLIQYEEGFPGYIIATLYGLLSSIFPASAARSLQLFSMVVFILLGVATAIIAYQYRNSSTLARLPVLALALIYPLAFTPYVQYHDLLMVVPILIAWASTDHSHIILNAAVLTYLGGFVLLLLSVLTDIAWVALIPIGLFVIAFKNVSSKHPDISLEM